MCVKNGYLINHFWYTHILRMDTTAITKRPPDDTTDAFYMQGIFFSTKEF